MTKVRRLVSSRGMFKFWTKLGIYLQIFAVLLVFVQITTYWPKSLLVEAQAVGVTSVSPNSGPVSGGSAITITGSNFGSLGEVWARKGASSGSDIAYGVPTDSIGNSYVTGSFSGTINFGSFSLTSGGGSTNVFLVKYDPSGKELWVVKGDSTTASGGNSVAVDASDNVYITGYYNTSGLTFGSVSLTNTAGNNYFLVKYNSAGVAQWGRQSISLGDIYGYAVGTDLVGNIYTTGSYSDDVSFGAFGLSVAGSKDMFLTKYDSAGNEQWAKNSTGNSAETGFGVVTDSANNVYVTGNFSGKASFGPFNLNSSGDTDAFLVNYNTNGTALMLKKGGSSNADQANGVAVGRSGMCL